MSEKGSFLRSLIQSPWTFLSVAMRAVGSLSVMKIVAVYFGPSGLALFSHFQNFIALITQVPEQGTNLSVIRIYHGFDPGRRSILIGMAFMLNCIMFILGIIMVSLAPQFFLKYFDLLERPLFAWLLAGSIFFILLNSLVLAFIYAKQSFRLLFGITIANVIILVTGVWTGAASGEFRLLLLGFAAAWGIYSLANFLILTLRKVLPATRLNFDRKMFMTILPFLGMALAGVVLGKWVDYFVRDFSIEWFGTEITGIWQAQVRMSDSYRSVFMGTFGVLFFSQISRMTAGTGEWTGYIRKMILSGAILTLLGLSLVYLLKNPLVLLLFREDLLPATEFLHFQLLADAFALPSYLLVFILVVRERWMLFVGLHLFSALVYLVAIVIVTGLTDMGVEGIPLSNMIRFILFTGVMMYVLRKDL